MRQPWSTAEDCATCLHPTLHKCLTNHWQERKSVDPVTNTDPAGRVWSCREPGHCAPGAGRWAAGTGLRDQVVTERHQHGRRALSRGSEEGGSAARAEAEPLTPSLWGRQSSARLKNMMENLKTKAKVLLSPAGASGGGRGLLLLLPLCTTPPACQGPGASEAGARRRGHVSRAGVAAPGSGVRWSGPLRKTWPQLRSASAHKVCVHLEVTFRFQSNLVWRWLGPPTVHRYALPAERGPQSDDPPRFHPPHVQPQLTRSRARTPHRGS